LTLFERGIARQIDFSFSGPQSLRIGQLLEDGRLELVLPAIALLPAVATIMRDQVPALSWATTPRSIRPPRLPTGRARAMW
jgi:hypothetical protein